MIRSRPLAVVLLLQTEHQSEAPSEKGVTGRDISDTPQTFLLSSDSFSYKHHHPNSSPPPFQTIPSPKMPDDPIETWTNHEREFRIHHDRFFKRSFRPSEYRVYRPNQPPYVPPQGFERLQNEAACLDFVRRNTTIPVPAVLEAYSDDGSFVLVTERLFGVTMCKLSPDEQALVMEEVETHLVALRGLRSDTCTIGGPSGVVCPPRRGAQYFPGEVSWEARKGEEGEFGFCHGDLSQTNVIVDPETLKVEGIVDWEYGGFWPEYSETHVRDPRPSGAQFREEGGECKAGGVS